MRAIIIGAGRGQRLMPTTANAPKCFAKVQGKRILDWVIDAFAVNGVTDICFIGGYLIDRVREAYPEFTFCHNDDWQNNNIMESLMYARDFMDEPFVCCYSDTLISPDLVTGLLAAEGEIALSVDTKWEARYEHRTEHPPNDAEKLTVDNGRVTQVHRDIDPANAYGEYTGVAKFGREGGALLKEHYSRCRDAYSGRPFREAALFEKAYLIHLLQDMLEAGVHMHHADTPGEYMEIDTQQDFELAQTGWKI
jgi:L-glutamine-phosphate cytidylyltransferase